MILREIRKHHRLNAGIYLIKRSFLENELPKLPASHQGEIYITDLIKKASEQGNRVEIVDLPFDYIRGVNTLKELWMAEHIKKSDIILSWMQKGVRFAAPQSVHIDLDVTLVQATPTLAMVFSCAMQPALATMFT